MPATKEIILLLENVLSDRGVPKNVKACIDESLGMLRGPAAGDAKSMKIAEAASILEEVSGDPNLSAHARTVLWDVISRLEVLK
jgi:uncharacterized protein (UPF0147 family)